MCVCVCVCACVRACVTPLPVVVWRKTEEVDGAGCEAGHSLSKKGDIDSMPTAERKEGKKQEEQERREKGERQQAKIQLRRGRGEGIKKIDQSAKTNESRKREQLATSKNNEKQPTIQDDNEDQKERGQAQASKPERKRERNEKEE